MQPEGPRPVNANKRTRNRCALHLETIQELGKGNGQDRKDRNWETYLNLQGGLKRRTGVNPTNGAATRAKTLPRQSHKESKTGQWDVRATRLQNLHVKPGTSFFDYNFNVKLFQIRTFSTWWNFNLHSLNSLIAPHFAVYCSRKSTMFFFGTKMYTFCTTFGEIGIQNSKCFTRSYY